MPSLPEIRQRLQALRARRSWRPSPELVAFLARAQVVLAELREDLADELAQEVVSATDDQDLVRIEAKVYAAVVLALPGEAAGPGGMLAEHVAAFVVARLTRAMLAAVHERAEARLAAMEAGS